MRNPTELKERKARQAADGNVAWREYLREADLTKAKTARLRALRLAREALPLPRKKK